MDNGRLQKEQAARFKHIVSQRKSSTRKQCQAKEAQSSKDFTRCLEPVLTDDALTHMPSPSTSLCPTTSGCQDQFLDAILDSFVAPTWSTPPQNDYLPTAPQSPGNESAHQQLFRSIESPHSCSLPPRDNGEPSWCAPDVVGEHELACMSSAIVPQDNPGSSINRWSNTIVEEWAWDLPSANDPFPSQVPMSDDAAGTPTLAAHPINHQVGNSKATPDALTEAVRNDTTEEALFMHYLDRVFYIQYPFYLSCDRRGRGCLFSMLKIVKPAYFATLALSERDILFSHPQQCNATARPVPPCAKGRYHELAVRGTQRLLQESHTWSRSVQMIHVVESLTSILQLLFWEVCGLSDPCYQIMLMAQKSSSLPAVQATGKHFFVNPLA